MVVPICNHHIMRTSQYDAVLFLPQRSHLSRAANNAASIPAIRTHLSANSELDQSLNATELPVEIFGFPNQA